MWQLVKSLENESQISVRLKNKWVQENNINKESEKDRLRLYKYDKNYSKSIIKKNPI